MIHSNNWKKGILSIDCTIRKNITDIIYQIGDYSCNPKSWHFDLDYWFSNCNFLPKEFKLMLDNIYQHLVVKCKDTIVEWVKLKPFTAYLDFSNDGEKIEAAQIKDAAKFLCKVMNNFNHTVDNLFSMIINLSDNATYTHEAITLTEDSTAIIVHETHEGGGDFHGLYTNTALVDNNSCIIQDGEMRLPYHESYTLPLQILVAIGGATSCLTIMGLLGKLIKDQLSNKYKKSPASLENTISLTELTDSSELATDNCEAVSMIGIDNAALASTAL